jgi:2',3'-cyclic-nucleotide 2'-phosphodiesterase (5'-nucleotidase family)
VQLTFLITGAENGYLLPTPGEGATTRGGAAELLGRWIALEGHCATPLEADGKSPCADDGTIALSTGDNANGQAISSYFRGEPVAQVMKLMGYTASAFGNRELDWAREQFLANTAKAGFPYLAANLRATDEEGKKLGLLATRVVTRRGVRVGIVGLASAKALVTPMPGRMTGLDLVPDEVAVTESVAALRRDGAQVVVLVSDGCLDDAAAMLEKNPSWGLAFVAARTCEVKAPDMVRSTRLVNPGRHWNEYARIAVTVDLVKLPGSQVTDTQVKLVDVVNGDGAPPADPHARELVLKWKVNLDAALGDAIGFTKAGLEQESPQMAQWLATAVREQFKADVGLVNRKGIRQSLPAGKVTKASVYDLIPFENEVVVAKVPGDALLKVLDNVEARVAGFKPKAGTGDAPVWVDGKGAPVDVKKIYTVATTDYLYLGGDGFALNEADKAPVQTRTSWQSALISWTTEKKTDEKKPLESLLKAK